MAKATSSLPALLLVTFVVFLCLKLAGMIAWSWWLVFLPLLASGALIMFAVFAFAIVALVAFFFSGD
jgi:hypothetical protein